MEDIIIQNTVREITDTLLKKLDIDYKKIEITFDKDDILRISITTNNDAGLLIGWHGKTLDALQFILKALIRKEQFERKFYLIVDIDEYKKRQEDNMIELAERKADLVKEFTNPQLLPPMNSYMRKLIHLHFVNNDKYTGITTESIGEGTRRQIKIKPV